MEWHDISGSAGVILVVGCYLFLQLRRLATESLSYSHLNAIGAALILVSLSVEFNLSAVLIELFWLIISVYGIFGWFRGERVSTSRESAVD